MKRVWVPKRYFFVHLAIFVALASAFATAGISSYQGYLNAQGAGPLVRRSQPTERMTGEAPVDLASQAILALSGPTK